MKANILRYRSRILLVSALAIFSVIAIACTTDANDDGGEVNGTNLIDPVLGAPGSVSGSISSGSSQSFPVMDTEPSIGIPPPDFDAYEVFPSGISSYQNFNSSAGIANSGIWVTGQGTIEIPADVAQISIGVESREASVADARQKAAEAMESVLDAIRDNGVSEDDIVTTNFNIYPQTVWVEVSDSLGRHSEPRITGYTVSNTVQVTVRDIDNLSPVVDTAAIAGGDLVRIHSIQFTVDDTSVYAEQIRQIAAADALAKADVYARAMGVTLGPLVYLTEHGSSVPMATAYPQAEMAAMDGAFKSSPISSGDVNLTVSIQAVFAIGG